MNVQQLFLCVLSDYCACIHHSCNGRTIDCSTLLHMDNLTPCLLKHDHQAIRLLLHFSVFISIRTYSRHLIDEELKSETCRRQLCSAQLSFLKSVTAAELYTVGYLQVC